MIIRDLEVLEVISEEANVEGGVAFSDADASAFASGFNFAATDTFTSTSASVFFNFGFPSGLRSSASSFSGSSSTAQ